MVIEASSHALSQDRLAGVNFRAAAFTNLTGDHLDYHKTMENYLAAKTRLFTALAPGCDRRAEQAGPANRGRSPGRRRPASAGTPWTSRRI